MRSSGLTADDGWQRLHPLSPIARIGRIVPVVILGFLLSSTHSQNGNGSDDTVYLIYAIVVVVAVIAGFVRWLVTRWRLDGDTLRIESGLIRHDSRQLPLARIQAVDIVQPFAARILGLAELRIRLAGSGSTDGKLAYLPEPAAVELRGRLLAGHRRPTPGAAAPEERPMASVGTGRLAASILLSGVGTVLIVAIVTLLVLADLSPKTAGAAVALVLIYLIYLAMALWRRLTGGFHFEATETPTGIHIHRGLFQTVSETIPLARIQAVRRVEPLLWRPLGWCRLEVDIAGAGTRNQRGEGSAVARKSLLPVGNDQDAWHLVNRLLGGPAPELSPPPRRARYKAPLSFHFLASGHDAAHAVCVTGRLRKVTTWVPLEKAQSIRRVQGPLQRRLALASVCVDVAGRRVRAEFRDRSGEEADRLVDELTDLSRVARRHGGDAVALPEDAGAPPAGWYADPSGRHQLRYWDRGRWTERVGNGGATAIDRL
ncbi:MAG: PH domain-containing protein [Acidimicrobiales bacterium]